MSLNPIPDTDADNSTINTAPTPPESIATQTIDDNPPSPPSTSSIPWPGSTFIIRCMTTNHLLTLLNGTITLAPPGSTRGSIHWDCVETCGWLGFQNPVSGKFLGHDKFDRLICTAGRQQWWENFCVRMRPEGGFVLLMTNGNQEGALWPVGMGGRGEGVGLAKVGRGVGEGLGWEFVRV